LRHAFSLGLNRILITTRNKVFIFFTLLMPLGMFFFFAGFVAKGQPLAVAYWMAPIVSMTVMGSFWGLSINLVTYREQGILRRFRLAPVSASDILASTILANFVLTIPTVILEVVLARWLYHVRNLGNLFSFALLVIIALFAFAALGLVVASVTNSVQETQIISQIIWFALLAPIIPMPLLPAIAKRFIVFLPSTYLVTGLQRALLLGLQPEKLWIEFSALAAWALLAFFLSTQIFRWEPEETIPRKAKLWALATILPFLILGAWENRYGHVQTQSSSIYRMATAAEDSQPANPPQQPAPQPVPAQQAPR